MAAAGKGFKGLSERWKNWRKTGRLHDLSLFAVFVVIAGVFWTVMALNDTVSADLDVRIDITGVPDTVTFINDPPSVIHVTVRDRGASLARRKFMQTPVLHFSFAEYASDGYLRVSQSALTSHVRALFGSNASFNITSADSISLMYTSAPAKTVPVKINADVTTALGKVLNGKPRASVREIKIYSSRDILDTIFYVNTAKIVRRGLADPVTLQVKLCPIKGVKMVPSTIDVTIPVEPLENRRTAVDISVVNVPKGESLVLFPAKAEVSYLVPMSMRDDSRAPFRVIADYASLNSAADTHIRLRLASPLPAGVTDAQLEQDSVEFTIIRQNKTP